MGCHCDYCEYGHGSYCSTEEVDRLRDELTAANEKIAKLREGLAKVKERFDKPTPYASRGHICTFRDDIKSANAIVKKLLEETNV